MSDMAYQQAMDYYEESLSTLEWLRNAYEDVEGHMLKDFHEGNAYWYPAE